MKFFKKEDGEDDIHLHGRVGFAVKELKELLANADVFDMISASGFNSRLTESPLNFIEWDYAQPLTI